MAKGQKRRPDRLARYLLKVLAEALQSQVADPALRGAVLTGARLSSDLAYAWIYWYRHDGADDAAIAAAGKGFTRAGPLLRGIVGRELRMRIVPELRFEYDKAIDDARRIETLLAEVAPDDE